MLTVSMVNADEKSVTALLKFFEQYIPLNDAERKEVPAKFTVRNIKRRSFILQPGDICKYFTFIVSHCFRQYAIDLLYLYTRYHKFDRNFRIIVERKYIELQNRVMQNISITAENRYINFINRYPDLANRLPNIQIASYLGITPEFLSKVRKKLVRPS